MKNSISFLIMLIAVTLFGCSSGNKDTSPKGAHEVIFNNNGNNFSIMISDSINVPVEIKEQSWGATEITIGNFFQISITENEGNIELIKNDNATNPVNRLKRYVKEDANLLFWESEITQPEFHFYLIIKVGNKTYIIEDIKGEIFTGNQVQIMIDAAKTIAAKEASPKS